jgi:hypothetical protein
MLPDESFPILSTGNPQFTGLVSVPTEINQSVVIYDKYPIYQQAGNGLITRSIKILKDI